MLILWLEEVGYQNAFFLGLSFLGRWLFEWRTSKYEFIDDDGDCQKRLMRGFLCGSIDVMIPAVVLVSLPTYSTKVDSDIGFWQRQPTFLLQHTHGKASPLR